MTVPTKDSFIKPAPPVVEVHFICVSESSELVSGILPLANAQFERDRKLNILQVFRVTLDTWMPWIQILIYNSRDMNNKDKNKYEIQSSY